MRPTAAEYDVNRKTIRRRLDAAAIADAERARRTVAKRAEQKRGGKWRFRVSRGAGGRAA